MRTRYQDHRKKSGLSSRRNVQTVKCFDIANIWRNRTRDIRSIVYPQPRQSRKLRKLGWDQTRQVVIIVEV